MTTATNAIGGNAGHVPGWGAPASHAFSIGAGDDTNELTYVVRGIWVGTAGDIKLTTIGGETITFVGAVAGSVVPVVAVKVFATGGTTASNMIGLY